MLNRITVQLPVEGLLFWKLSGREAMSESFALTLTLLGTTRALTAAGCWASRSR